VPKQSRAPAVATFETRDRSSSNDWHKKRLAPFGRHEQGIKSSPSFYIDPSFEHEKPQAGVYLKD
jgi:hypothetical protein